MLDFEENDQIMVSRITLEYIVANSSEGKTLITPVWRFWLGSDDDERNFLRHKILDIRIYGLAVLPGRKGKHHPGCKIRMVFPQHPGDRAAKASYFNWHFLSLLLLSTQPGEPGFLSML